MNFETKYHHIKFLVQCEIRNSDAHGDVYYYYQKGKQAKPGNLLEIKATLSRKREARWMGGVGGLKSSRQKNTFFDNLINLG